MIIIKLKFHFYLRIKRCKVVTSEGLNEELMNELSKKLEQLKRGKKILSPVTIEDPAINEKRFEIYLSKVEEYKVAAKKYLEMEIIPVATLYACCAALAILMITDPVRAANFLAKFLEKINRRDEAKRQPIFRFTLLLLKFIAHNNKEFLDEAKKVFWNINFINREEKQFVEQVLRYLGKSVERL